MSTNVVERLHDEFVELHDFLVENDGVTLVSVVEENFPKALLLAAASHFESQLKNSMKNFVMEVTDDDHPLVSLIEGKVIERQYHTWFDWESRNANRFFRMFGLRFKNHADSLVKKDDDLRKSISSFMEIGGERNKLVHQDFANFQMNKTSSEVYDLYKSATMFVSWFPNTIREFSSTSQETT